MKLVGYIRVISDGQAENTSLLEQRKKIEAYCVAFGHELVAVYEEIGSGKNVEHRPKFQEALESLKNNAEGIIAAKLDRLARNTRDVLTLVEDVLQPNNKALVLLDLQVDTSTPTGRMILTVMAAVATLERDVINERTQGGRKSKSDNGGFAYGSPKFGQVSKDKQLEDSESEQQVIEIIRRHHKSGKSLRAIAEYLDKNGHKSKQGKNWQPSSIKNVLDRLYDRK
jgi:DNA invertase Pin-like site-specific DNA recombinase